MPKDEYKELIKKYMDELKIPYICLKQIKRFEYENKVKYDQVFLKTYNDIVENGYNISIL